MRKMSKKNLDLKDIKRSGRRAGSKGGSGERNSGGSKKAAGHSNPLRGFAFHKTGFRLLKMAHSIDSTFLPLYLLRAIINVGSSYGSLMLNAALIDALLAARFRRAILFAGVLLLLDLLVRGIISPVLSKVFLIKGDRYEFLFYILLHEKAMSLDYETMEDPQMSEKILRSEKTASMYGGLLEVLYTYLAIWEDILSLLFSAAMVVALCFQRPKGGGGFLSFLASPAVSFSWLLLIVIVSIILLERVNRHFAKEVDRFVNSFAGEELKVMYMLKVFTEAKFAKLIRIFGMKDMLLENEKELNKHTRDFYKKSEGSGIIGRLFQGGVSSVYTVSAYLLVSVKAVTGAITVGAFTQYVGALGRFVDAFAGMIKHNGIIRRCCVYMSEFLEVMDAQNIHPSGNIPVEKRDDGEYEFAFEHVSFRYPGSRDFVLKDVSCRLNTGQKMALVGRNGAGKTTFIKLLCRLYVPTEGRITLNGVDIRKYDEEEYKDLLSVVFQDYKLFAFPVWENVAAGYTSDRTPRHGEAARKEGGEKKERKERKARKAGC